MTREFIKKGVCISLLVTMILTSMPGRAMAKEKNEEITVTEDVAVTVATLFVQANLDQAMWDMDTQVEKLIPMRGKDGQPSAYCVVYSNHEKAAGYVIVSTDLYDQLIVEYSPEFGYIVDSLSHEMILLDRLDQTIYYKGSLQYSLDEEVVAEDQEIEITEEMQKTRLQNEALIQEISPIVVTLTSGYITYPLYFLQANYPGHTFSLSGSAETGYILQYAYSETNADVVYATAAILKYYLGSSAWFSTVVSNCLSIAQSGGYAPYAASGDYNIPSSNVQSYAQACINSYGLGKQAANVTSQIWTYGKNEINANRPFILWINSSTSYSNHAVTAFGWYNYIDAGINNYCFFKVNDGYSTAASRYVYVNTCSGTMTKIV